MVNSLILFVTTIVTIVTIVTISPTVSGFGTAVSFLNSKGHTGTCITSGGRRRSSSSTSLFGIRCEDKTYQLEEMEDKDTCTTEVLLRADRNIQFGDTDGPIPADVIGKWEVDEGTDNYRMAIRRKFVTGQDNTDMGEFTFEVEKLYVGEMTMVGESVAITGKIMAKDEFNPAIEREVGYFNMIDGTDDRISYAERAEKLTS
mmetsp:Transcript_5905/g.7460  ORF Transcript_5905/g.7460 Transcript_5905/m.7460 type:complete len:202 (-) Transcript_5905:304-909(-)|eukprot:CAMPEP_0172496670 /NCGR_PEP_ID=MMETSP1066-20121228/91124_1 /TAXON_ID=671091 /ORGANISM="Coscinodiscus wailesii, Strain CCMP2513" /LENGTH=201 /DNA_ID=CAMNT_0013269083 /DNA_START=60 /DNA_END=665 /DNA_ORIENTATION=+